jgi:hypothetical protein
MPRKAQNIPANENAAQRFTRLANQKVNSVLTSLKGIGGLGNAKQYTSTKEQREKIQTALENGVKRAMETMNRGGESAQDFKL